ncbi:uncharacterized mitochondrial protein AtMg01250-like [Rutidosis leptorrhynchoides]|uniref:uncharacterized mitochondrial protein AtMg01250-like n=1 Tax=Rutidosis leptorrhynchoides TaxID=125765 RepID=UPI003A99C6A1
MGFGAKWRNWILSCLKSTSISILVNGSPTNEFKLGRGVRQSNPLSPFLFILVAEGLNILTKAEVRSGLFSGVEVGNDRVPISILQYANDTIFFGSWNESSILNLTKLLKCVELTSGLKVNYHKSNIFGVGVNKLKVDAMANKNGCKVGSFPFIYLGLSIGAKMNKMASWEVVAKFDKRLSD